MSCSCWQPVPILKPSDGGVPSFQFQRKMRRNSDVPTEGEALIEIAGDAAPLWVIGPGVKTLGGCGTRGLGFPKNGPVLKSF